MKVIFNIGSAPQFHIERQEENKFEKTRARSGSAFLHQIFNFRKLILDNFLPMGAAEAEDASEVGG